MGKFGQFGSTPEEAMGLARARSLEAEHAARHLRAIQPDRRPSGRSVKRMVLIGLGLFVLFGWTMTLLTALRAG
jgi:hypothetical protein